MSAAPVKPAIFLDRDGTLIEDRGWLRSPADAIFFKDTFDALRMLQQKALLFIVTNQSGIARGLLTSDEARQVNDAVVDRLRQEGIRIEAVYTCPHTREEGCGCIKPNPFFVLQAAAEFNIAPGHSFAVGDHPHDVELARRFGGQGVYVLTGHGTRHREELPPGTCVAPTIGDAAAWIARELRDVPPNYIGASEAALRIRAGAVVAIPTETVYGMAANALDARAVQQVFTIKQRPALDPLIVHLADPADLSSVAACVPTAAQALADAFWPGPLTLVLPKKACIPDLVTSGRGTVAVRVPIHTLARKIIREAGCPVAAPSANRFGTISPTCARHVHDQFGEEVGGIVDGGPCAVGVESTIVGFWDDQVWLLRPGGIPLEAIESRIGRVALYKSSHPDDIRAPGTMPRHYAPGTPMELLDGEVPVVVQPDTGYIVFGPDSPGNADNIVNLSPSGDLAEAAASLYEAMRRLDAAGFRCIQARCLPDQGLGRTVNDRLRRAATP